MESGRGNIESALFELRKRLNTLETELLRLNELHQEREKVRQAIFGLEQILGTPREAGEMPIWEHARAILASKNNTPMGAGQIALLVASRGGKLEGKNPAESLRTVLIRKPDMFERVEGGKFRLKS